MDRVERDRARGFRMSVVRDQKYTRVPINCDSQLLEPGSENILWAVEARDQDCLRTSLWSLSLGSAVSGLLRLACGGSWGA